MPDLRERAAVLALVAVTEREWHRTASLIEATGSAMRIIRGEWSGAEPSELRALGEELGRRVAPDALDRYAKMIQKHEAQGVRTITVLDADYPTNLREIYNLPPMLFTKGALLSEDERAVAVVGTRHPSAEGRRRARQLATDLAGRGITVLSGLARGIDTAAHEGALDVGGRTVAVLGTGILRVYPPENAALAERIPKSGALVSQFWPDAPPTRFSFPIRNVVMSGMALGTVVVEAGPTSGAKMQARFALDHGKRVFLLESLVLKQEWAQQYRSRPGVVVVPDAEKIVDLVERLVRSPQQLTLTLVGQAPLPGWGRSATTPSRSSRPSGASCQSATGSATSAMAHPIQDGTAVIAAATPWAR